MQNFLFSEIAIVLKNLQKTSELSFILKPSSVEGIGVFAYHEIIKGSYLKLFSSKEKVRKIPISKLKDNFFKRYCLEEGKILYAPENFGRMSVGWYLNHSEKPNAAHRNYRYYSLRKIRAGEEITIDYNTL